MKEYERAVKKRGKKRKRNNLTFIAVTEDDHPTQAELL